MTNRRSARLWPVLLLCCLLPPSFRAQTTPARQPILVFMTDFGQADDSVAICKGVMLSVAPNLRIVDLTHEVTPYSIADAARFLAGAAPYYPAGTVIVAVIDPGVGSSRKAIVAKSKRGQYFVLPDNGLLTFVQDSDGIEGVHEITNTQWMIESPLSSTFHGRDIFSPVGAHLARGDNWEEVGPPLKAADLVRLPIRPVRLDAQGLTGEVIAVDGPFGSLITNVSRDQFSALGYRQGDTITINFTGRTLTMPFVKTFSDVSLNQPLAYIDSRGRLGFAINQGSFAKRYNIAPPMSFGISRKS